MYSSHPAITTPTENEPGKMTKSFGKSSSLSEVLSE
jgi:hypothetical protein